MENEIKSRWIDIIQYLKTEYNVSEVSFKTWLLNINLYSVDEENDLAIILVNDNIGENGLNFIKEKYGLFLKTSIAELTGYVLNLEFKLKSSVEKVKQVPPKSKDNLTFNLNPKYTFDTFIVGNNNSLAHAASVAVAESPINSEYNPLYIYGGPGLGKTHLIHSIAHYILENSPELKILYVTSEQYINEIVEAMRNSKQDRTMMNNFKKKYREVDVLMVDDVQFITGKVSFQEEFFNTFNALYEQGKQIILTSDKHPNQLDHLDERYRSRFNWGLPIDITVPDYETKLAILREKNEQDKANLSEDILKYLAENITTNIRDLEGAFKTLLFRSRLNNSSLTLDEAINDIKDLIVTEDKNSLTNDYIINIVIEHYGITLEEINSKNRSMKISNARQMCMYLCRKLTHSSYESIGASLGKRDRTTVMHGCDKIEKELENNSSLQTEVELLISHIIPNK